MGTVVWSQGASVGFAAEHRSPALHSFAAALGLQPSTRKARSEAKPKTREAEALPASSRLKGGVPVTAAFLLLSNIKTPSRLKIFKGVGW
jgi:hypothetical protein